MAITEITLEDGERALAVDTEEEFARALDRGLPIVAPGRDCGRLRLPHEMETGRSPTTIFGAEVDDHSAYAAA